MTLLLLLAKHNHCEILIYVQSICTEKQLNDKFSRPQHRTLVRTTKKQWYTYLRHNIVYVHVHIFYILGPYI